MSTYSYICISVLSQEQKAERWRCPCFHSLADTTLPSFSQLTQVVPTIRQHASGVTMLQSLYLHGFVIPTIGPVFMESSSMQHLKGHVGVAELHSAGAVQAHQANAPLDHVQGVAVGGVWGWKGENVHISHL